LLVKFEGLFVEEAFLHVPDQRVIRLNDSERNAAGFGCREADMLGKMSLQDLGIAHRSAN